METEKHALKNEYLRFYARGWDYESKPSTPLTLCYMFMLKSFKRLHFWQLFSRKQSCLLDDYKPLGLSQKGGITSQNLVHLLFYLQVFKGIYQLIRKWSYLFIDRYI